MLNVMKSADGPGELWLDDVTVNGEAEDFTRDPGRDGVLEQFHADVVGTQPLGGDAASDHRD